MKCEQLDLFTFEQLQMEPKGSDPRGELYRALKDMIDIDAAQYLPARFLSFAEVYPSGSLGDEEWRRSEEFERMDRHNRTLWKLVAPMIGRCPLPKEYLPARLYREDELYPVHARGVAMFSAEWKAFQQEPEFRMRQRHNELLVEIVKPKPTERGLYEDEE